MSNKKILLLFDYDTTISNEDSFCTVCKNVLPKDKFDHLIYLAKTDNYINCFNYGLKEMKKLNLTIEDLNKEYEKIAWTEGMDDLFNYIKENKNKYSVVLFSSSIEYGLKYMLTYHKVIDIFDGINCTHTKESNDNDQFLYAVQKFTHDCKICNPCNCKTKDFKEYSKSHDMSIFSKVIFICDGGNDLCLAKNLSKNDTVMPRKNLSLYKKLFSDPPNKVDCEVVAWTSGHDIIKYLKSLS